MCARLRACVHLRVHVCVRVCDGMCVSVFLSVCACVCEREIVVCSWDDRHSDKAVSKTAAHEVVDLSIREECGSKGGRKRKEERRGEELRGRKEQKKGGGGKRHTDIFHR